jgi:hypothetical protein
MLLDEVKPVLEWVFSETLISELWDNRVNSVTDLRVLLLLLLLLLSPVWKAENTAVGIRYGDHVAPSVLKSWH